MTKDKCRFCGGSTNNRKFTSFSLDICEKCKIAQTKPAPSDIDYSKNDFQAQFNATNINDLDPIWKKLISKQINLLQKNLAKGSKILEIGCGQGLTLSELNKLGYLTTGVEPSISASKIGKKNGLDIINKNYPYYEITKEKHDAIVITQVLEHIKYPDIFIKSVRGNLRKNGILLLTQTNYLGLLPKIMKEKWYPWVPEQHYWHFTPDGLKKYMFKMGFNEVETVYSSNIHPFSFMMLISFLIPNLSDQFIMLFKKKDG